MADYVIPSIFIAVLLVLILGGVHIVVALGISSLLGIYLVTGRFDLVLSMLSSTAFEALHEYVFAVLPLFVLMGEFISKSGCARDVYIGTNRLLVGLPGRLALATVLGNVIFAFVTGSSIAAAAAFSRISYPQMLHHNYDKRFALGLVAGSACLGMLIPPSILMIVWGVITEQSIGALFIAGVLPGFLLASLFCIYILTLSRFRPEFVGDALGARDQGAAAGNSTRKRDVADAREPSRAEIATSSIGLGLLITAVLGGIWLGFFTPTEAAGIGALMAFILALLKGMRLKGLVEAVMESGRILAPLLLLIIMALLYSRLLALSGVVGAVQDNVLGSGLPPWLIIAFIIALWLLLGMFIDSVSIMLLTVPVVAPLAAKLGYNPVGFALVGILAIECGLLTPPFGLIVYAVKTSVSDDSVSLGQVFAGSTPFAVMLLIVTILVAIFPPIATWLPSHM